MESFLHWNLKSSKYSLPCDDAFREIKQQFWRSLICSRDLIRFSYSAFFFYSFSSFSLPYIASLLFRRAFLCVLNFNYKLVFVFHNTELKRSYTYTYVSSTIELNSSQFFSISVLNTLSQKNTTKNSTN